MTAFNPLPSAISIAWPSSPKPVTSVMATTPSISARLLPATLRVVMRLSAAIWSFSLTTLNFSALLTRPIPKGLVRNITEPAAPLSLRFTFDVSIIPVTARPNIGSAQLMLWPPARGMPADSHTVRAPETTSPATDAGSFSRGHPRIAIAIKGSPPMA
ncbi:hypothetical protein SDC9_164158 [bioreactor metagenome]|uniref:Uncharacterized protein n=1 Tax=bioreactor metagenome TaxID=1076179 RepID=A0A645FQX2_9ZZZZ